MSNSLRLHGLEHTSLPSPSLSPGVCSNSSPLSQGCYLTIPSSVIPSSSCLQSFPASRSFPMNLFFASGGQSSPSNEYPGLISFRIDWFDLIAVQGTLKSLLQQHNSKASILQLSAFFMVQLSYLYMTTGKTIVFTIQTFVSKVIFMLFNMLSTLVIAFLLQSKCLLIFWLQSPSTVILECKKIKSVFSSVPYSV